jgi:hypothetical protein
MIGRIIHYHQLKRNNLPHRLAWSMSGLRWHAHKVIRAMAFLTCCACVLYLLSAEANSSQAVADNRVAAKVTAQAGEIEELRRILAKCLTKGDSPLWIGEELFFCGLSATGITR